MANPSVTYTFVNSQTSDGTQVNQNFTDLINALTDGTKDFTINNLTVNTAFIAKGTTQLGDASSDTIDTQAQFINNLIPSTNNARDLGSASLAWRNLYVGIAAHADGTSLLPSLTFLNDLTTGIYRSGAGSIDIAVSATQVMHMTSTSIGAIVPYVSPVGSAGAPTYSFSGRNTNGLFSPGANQVAVSTNGTQALLFDASQNVTMAGTQLIAATSLTIKTNNGTAAITINTTQDIDFAPTNGVYAGQAGSGTSFTNAVVPFLAGNTNSTTNNWAGYGFTDGSSHSGSLNAFIACQFTDRTNHYGFVSIGTRGAGGFKAGVSLDQNQNCIVGLGSLATTATDGFLYIPSCAGAPTGSATSVSGYHALVWDTTNTKLWVNTSGTTWKGIVLA